MVGAAIEEWLKRGPAHDVWMLTLTSWHTADHSVADSIEVLKQAWTDFQNSKTWRKWARRWGLQAQLRVFDNTWGDNGLHAHWHVGLFVDRSVWTSTELPFVAIRGLTEEARQEVYEVISHELRDVWLRAHERHRRLPEGRRELFLEHGLHLTGGEKAAEYFTKWGQADELVMGVLKPRNQFGLLTAFSQGDQRAGELYREYYEATKGLSVMRGLAKVRRIVGLTDEDVEAYKERQREARERQLAADGVEPPPEREPIRVEIRSYLFAAAVKVGWPAVQEVVEAAREAGESLQRAVDRFLWWNLPTAYLRETGPPGELSDGCTVGGQLDGGAT